MLEKKLCSIATGRKLRVILPEVMKRSKQQGQSLERLRSQPVLLRVRGARLCDL